MQQLAFKRVHPDAVMPKRVNAHDAGLDLRTVERVELQPGLQQSVSTGLAVAIPEGMVGLIFPRSGNAAKKGITLANAVGVIDSGYRGELKVLLSHQGDEAMGMFYAEPGDRIAQLVIVPCLLPAPVEVAELPESTDGRGDRGFGSSGLS